MIRSLYLAASILILALPAAARDKVPAEAYAEVNAALVAHHAVPRYQQLAEATAVLAVAAEHYCAGPDEAGLAALRYAYGGALDAWMRVQHLRFGPVELFMRSYRLYFWPEGHGRIDKAIAELASAGDEQALAPASFQQASAAAQGLPALETLLYGEPGLDGDAFRCGLAVAITINLRDMAAGILAEWRDGEESFALAVTEPGSDAVYFQSERDATLAFFKSLHDELQLVADVKLKPVLGKDLATAKPALAESVLEGRALANIALNLEALQALYEGVGGPGLSAIVVEHGGDETLDPLMRKAFPITIATARSIEAPLGEAVVDPAVRPEVEKLLTQVLALKQIVRERVAPALDLGVGFNALDGD